jgi:hypothetical protein
MNNYNSTINDGIPLKITQLYETGNYLASVFYINHLESANFGYVYNLSIFPLLIFFILILALLIQYFVKFINKYFCECTCRGKISPTSNVAILKKKVNSQKNTIFVIFFISCMLVLFSNQWILVNTISFLEKASVVTGVRAIQDSLDNGKYYYF